MTPSELICYALLYLPWPLRNIIVSDTMITMAFEKHACSFPHPIPKEALIALIRAWRKKYQ